MARALTDPEYPPGTQLGVLEVCNHFEIMSQVVFLWPVLGTAVACTSAQALPQKLTRNYIL